MPSFPLSSDDERLALKTLGIQSVDDLFASVSPKQRENAHFEITLDPSKGRGLTEIETVRFFSDLAALNSFPQYHSRFLGGGIYDNPVPAVVRTLQSGRKVSFGSRHPRTAEPLLARICETRSARLLPFGMATAVCEIILQTVAHSSPKPSVSFAGSLNPEMREILKVRLGAQGIELNEIAWDNRGQIDIDKLKALGARTQSGVLVVGYPNYFGIVEPIDRLRAELPSHLPIIATVADLSALSLFEAPGTFGIDWIVGELGSFGTTTAYSADSRMAFVASDLARLGELKLPDHRSTSPDSFSQESDFVGHLGALGKSGFQRLGELNYSQFSYLASELAAVGIPLKFSLAPHYREGIFEVPNLELRFARSLREGIIPGIKLTEKFDELSKDEFANCLLVAVSPRHTKAQLDGLVEILSHD